MQKECLKQNYRQLPVGFTEFDHKTPSHKAIDRNGYEVQ